MITLLAILIIALLFNSPVAYADQPQKAGYLKSNIYVRPEKGSELQIGILKEGSYVEGSLDGNWLEINYQGKKAFISSLYLADQLESNFSGYLQCDAYLRPSKESKEYLTILKKGDFIEGFDEGAWLHIIYEDQDAYIAKNLLGEKPEEEATILKGYSTSSLFIRPAIESQEKLGILKKGEFVTGIVQGNWLKIKFNGKEAYIAKAFIQENKPEPEDPPKEQELSGYLSSSLYVRPNIASKKSLGILEKGSPVSGVVQGSWLQINYKGQKAYISKNYVREDPVEVVEEILEGYIRSSIYVRPEKGSSRSLGTLVEGTYVKGLVQGAWLKITFNDQEAYIAKTYITEEKPGEEYSAFVYTNTEVLVKPKATESLGQIIRGTKVSGLAKDGYLKIQFEGKEGYIPLANLSTINPLEEKIYIAKNSPVFDEKDQVTGDILVYGTQITGVEKDGKVFISSRKGQYVKKEGLISPEDSDYPSRENMVATVTREYNEGILDKTMGKYGIKYQDWFQKRPLKEQTHAWCVSFTMWAAEQINLTQIHSYPSRKEMNYDAYVQDLMDWYIEQGRFYKPSEYNPKIGDLIIFDWLADGGRPDHVGVVVDVTNLTVFTIEGNSKGSGKEGPHDGAIHRIEYKKENKVIKGYCSPDYVE